VIGDDWFVCLFADFQCYFCTVPGSDHKISPSVPKISLKRRIDFRVIRMLIVIIQE
jgi:hypothetical protein